MSSQTSADDTEATSLTLVFLWSLLFGTMIGLGHGFPFGGPVLPAAYWIIWGLLESLFALCLVRPSIRRSRAS